MDSQGSVSVAGVERPRRYGWGDATARWAMSEIAENLRRVGGYESCAIEVLRSDAMLEFVALATDNPLTRSEHDGASSPLAAMFPALDQGTEIGALRFIRAEDMTPEAFESMAPYSVFPNVEPHGDPTRWHKEDMLVAQVCDEQGELRGLVYFDDPHDGRRPSRQRITDFELAIRPILHGVLVQIEREEFAQRIRLASATRAVIRSAAPQIDVAELFRLVRDQLREPFRAEHLWIDTIETFDGDPVRSPGPEIRGEAGAALTSALVRAWDRQTVLIIEPDHVWGDDDLDRHFRDDLTPHVTQRGLREIVLVPVGVGPDTLGVLAVARDVDAPRWTDDESAAALDVAHDLGRAMLNARATEREFAAVAELRRLDDYRRTLIDTVGRELQRPLSVVSGHLELLAGMDLPHDAERSLVPMVRNTARLMALADDLALLSRVADSTRRIGTATLDLADLTADAIARVLPGADHRDVSVSLDVSGEPVVQGHALELSRCIGGLLDNAVTFSAKGGLVEVEVSSHDDDVVLVVRDHGIGISSKDQALLFGEFFRSADPAALDRHGYGLGLSIVRQVVLRHGGTVGVESSRGEGSTFRVVFPKANRRPS